jgi:hypothetical protein
MAQERPIPLERRGVRGRGVPEGMVELLGDAKELDKLDAVGKCPGQERPVVLRPVGVLDHAELRTVARRRLELGVYHRLQCGSL